MPLLKINADGSCPVLDAGGDLDAELTRVLSALPASAPVMVLIHGYKFSPSNPAKTPHRHILSLSPRPGCRKAKSWPRNLGFGRGDAEEGLCIAFGWEARGSIWRAWRIAEQAGRALADLTQRIQRLRPQPVDILCHSLGARVALGAMTDLPGGSMGRVVMMAGAEYRGAAQTILNRPAGITAEFVNVISRENDAFDVMVEWLIRPKQRGDRALGAGLGACAANWLDLQLDCPRTIEVLRDLGYRVPTQTARICHWSAYLRPGVFRFYRDLIRDRDLLPLDRLGALLPDQPTPRWSGLWQGRRAAPHLTALQAFQSRISRTIATGP